jgi:two-component system, NarL family, invasion response regulator UvrY
MRVLLVDDHAVVRRGVGDVLREAFPGATFGEAEDPQQALRCIAEERWDLVLLDLTLPGRGGIDALKEIKRLRPELPVLVLSMHSEAQYAVRVLRAGASGYLTKGSAPAVILEAVRRVLAGGTHVSPALAETLARGLRAGGGRPVHELLSDRELEVLKQLAAGKTNKEIAAELSLSDKTVSTYRTRLLDKLGLRTNAELVQYARSEGLVT